MQTLKVHTIRMSDAAAYERRILAGIPFYVTKSAPKDARIPIFSWSPERIPFGHWSPDGGLELHLPAEAVAALNAWRRAQVPRPRAQLRVGR